MLKGIFSFLALVLSGYFFQQATFGLAIMFAGLTVSIFFMNKAFLFKNIRSVDDLVHEEEHPDLTTAAFAWTGDCLMAFGIIWYFCVDVF